LLRLQERLSYALADRVVSVNETMRENLRRKGVDEARIFILNNFPDERVFPPRETRAAWPQRRDRLTLLYCGTITEHYDVGLAVKAMAKLAGEIPLRLRILGEGNRLAEVLRLASDLGIRDAVEHVGSVPIDKVRDEMQNADIGISCHRAGVFGDLYFATKIVEYLTQSLPALTPRTYTIMKYLPEDAVFYFEPSSEVSLVETLRFMWNNPGEVVRRLAIARTLLPKLSWQAEKSRFLDFYANVVRDGDRSPRLLTAR
jgi:glycosyltransferase involved in cell wall biosynthesis